MHSKAILKSLVERIRRQWPNVKIIFRGDPPQADWRLMRWCDRNNVGYITGIARNPVLEQLARQWTDESAKQFEQTGQKQRIFGEFAYAAETWDCRRRVIVKAEHLEQGANTRFIVTNLEGEPQKLYDELYCQRGEAENRIKESATGGLGLFADSTSCHDFAAKSVSSVAVSGCIYLDPPQADASQGGSCK